MNLKPDFRVVLYLFAAFTVCALIIVGSYVKTQELAAQSEVKSSSDSSEKSEVIDI